MLVLSRKVGETIFVGTGAERISVTVVEIDRGKIRLGIDAPRAMPVFRSELAPYRDQPKQPARTDDVDRLYEVPGGEG